MKPIWIVAKNTFKEVIRDRILYGLFVFAILIIGMSLALGQLSFAGANSHHIEFRIDGDSFECGWYRRFCRLDAGFQGAGKQTILTVLVRPLSRTQFILGKFLGLIAVILTVMLGLTAILGSIFLFMGQAVTPQLLLALFGILLESICLLSFALFFSIFSRPISVVILTLGIFLIGHWLSSLRYFGEKLPGSTVDWTYRNS